MLAPKVIYNQSGLRGALEVAVSDLAWPEKDFRGRTPARLQMSRFSQRMEDSMVVIKDIDSSPVQSEVLEILYVSFCDIMHNKVQR